MMVKLNRDASSTLSTLVPITEIRPASKEYTNAYLERVEQQCRFRPYLNIVAAFIRNDHSSNSACADRTTISKNVTVFGRTTSGWIRGPKPVSVGDVDRIPSADMHVIILDYLDSQMVTFLGMEFGIDPGFFYNHLAGSEQHHSGIWWPSDMSRAPPVLSERLEASTFSVTFRRCYTGTSDPKDKAKYLLGFDKRRIDTCSILRSFHRSQLSKRIFGSERLTVYESSGPPDPKWGHVVILLCDPIIPEESFKDTMITSQTGLYTSLTSKSKDDAQSEAMMAQITQWIEGRPHGFQGNHCLPEILTGPLRAIIYQWSSVAQDMDHQVSATEDQLEGDFWDYQRDPRRVLTTIQRLGRRLVSYTEQVHTARTDLVPWLNDTPIGGAIQADFDDVERKFTILTKRSHRAVPSLTTYITMEESKKMSRLTMVALLFAPLSLLASFLGIDGKSSMGGLKYWIFIGVAVPAMVLIIAFSRPFGGFREAIRERRTLRALGNRLGNWNAKNLT